MKIAIILGTRPEIIKLTPIIRELEKRNLDYFILHTGQHYSYDMDKIFFEELNLPQAKYNLEIGSHIQGKQINLMIKKIKEKLEFENPDIILVEGDTNTVLAGALSAFELGIKIGHVESGLRSNDIIIEEFNRILTDIYSDYCFAPTKNSRKNLLNENIDDNKIFITGNTIVDAVYQNTKIADLKYNILKDLNLEKNGYILVTCHRSECVDVKEKLNNILEGLKLVYDKFKIPVIFPMHPRTRNKINEFNLIIPKELKIIEPLGYLEFLQLMVNSRLIITDSGGIQEESCILKIPCVTIREKTERPETLEVGSNVLVGYDKNKLLENCDLMINKERKWENPFGDGKAAEKIVDIILKMY